ncbi:terminase TerL endonuclease subunit [Lacicoccus qingdaonensis]|uniref:Phage terminase-like protein, large subunit, contains N-terminal HTH domain n=1 Tax=Lacicoccus qingdaonensis TaxID=576118 RepID=A0A1G9F1M1_9BACL|nr:terminase TerL endonuclease subunit [Salinicoccus qingdaonensis]SDK82337.1 Phage terminase-like protein, large subunit, contains N-terminal HTH domain [Salinicoccus qingdaonensis]
MTKTKTRIPKHVTDYINKCRKNKQGINKDRLAFFNILEENIFPKVESGELHFDERQIEQCIQFIEKWHFELRDFQKYLVSFVFLYVSETGRAYYKEFLWVMGRGAGKNGLVSGISHYMISGLHGVQNYHGTVVANSEKQAKTSYNDIYNVVHGDRSKKLIKLFPATKTETLSRETMSVFNFATSNPDTKDGGRQGFLIFDEIHQYETSELINVFRSGLGKVKDGRTFYIGSEGYVRDGFMDTQKAIAESVIEGEHPDSRLFPFICKLDEREEYENPELWSKANPMLERPLNEYAEILLEEIKEEFMKLQYDDSSLVEFLTKRMNFPEEDPTKTVTSWENIQKASRPMPLLNNRTAIVGVDYANTTDFAAVGFLFRIDNDYVWHSHQFARQGFLDRIKLKPPIKEWEKEGHLTIVDRPTIEPELLVEWVQREVKRLNIRVHKVMIDRFRYDLTRPAFEGAGFNLEPLNYMPSVHAQVSPRIELIFNNRQVIWGDNPLMRWNTQNTAVKIKKDGNKEYIKKDPIRRKTDGFHAFLHALFKSDEIVGKDIKKSMDMMDRLLG